MPTAQIRRYLDENNVHYATIMHSPAYTAQETAATVHVPGRELAKTLIVLLDGQPAMAVLPATRKLDLGLLRKASGATKVELASEEQFARLFPGCEVGAMPPFGNLYHMPVYVGRSLAEDEHIAFNACSHTELIRMAYADFERLVQPTVAKLAR
jgi:Ala-tRNA(Pro) deacylase